MVEIDLCFYNDRPDGERIDVGSGIFIVLWPNGDIGMEHICPGIVHMEGDEGAVFRICPLWPGEIVAREPLTLRPSLLCNGAGLPCGLHGFVENGVWRSV